MRNTHRRHKPGIWCILWTLLLPAPVYASLEVCNITPHLINVAIAHDASGSWESRGWWLVEAGACTEIIQSELQQREYYMLATSAGSAMSWGNSKEFCISSDSSFARAAADQPCSRSTDLRRKFFQIDATGVTSFTQTLNCNSCDPLLYRQAAERIQATLKSAQENTRLGVLAGADSTALYQSTLSQFNELGRALRLLELADPQPSPMRKLLIMRGQYQLELGKQATSLYPDYSPVADFTAAIADFRAAMEIYPEDGDREREANISWAESQLALGELLQARGILNTLF